MTDRADAPPPAVSESYYYPHVERQTKTRLVTETYEYDAPFKYENVVVRRQTMMSRESHGVELSMVNVHFPGKEPVDVEGDSITITEPHPIVRVAVIGSACTPPGYVQIECDPVPEWRNRYEVESVMPARFRINGLWGMHMRYDAMLAGRPGVEPGVTKVGEPTYGAEPEALAELYPSKEGWTAEDRKRLKAHYREHPLAGMSCAVFEIPPSLNVSVLGGSEIPGWSGDNFPADHHYSFRTIRSTVLLRREAVD